MIPIELYRKKYDINNYECSRFAVDVCNVLFNSTISNDFDCFLKPKKERYADISIHNKFYPVKYPNLIIGDIVVLRNLMGNTHVAVKIDDGFIHLTEKGVFVVTWEVLNFGYNRSKVYRHVSNSIRL